jgi:hypothetical protein
VCQRVAAAVVAIEPSPVYWDDAQHASALAEQLGARPGDGEWADFVQARHEAAVVAGVAPAIAETFRRTSKRVGAPVERTRRHAWGMLANTLAADDGDAEERDADGYLIARAS